MNSRRIVLVFILMLISIFTKINVGFGQITECFNIEINSSDILWIKSQQNVAVNDTFILINSCNSGVLTGCVISNDEIKTSDSIEVCFVYAPEEGTLSFGTNGMFTFVPGDNFTGEVNFKYRLCNINNPNDYTESLVLIVVLKDNDCDGVTDEYDLDNDNDGILDIDEGEGLIDSDLDGIPDNFDIDSDNDGITDITEWQLEGSYVAPTGNDSNNDGWDDAFDGTAGGEYYELTDTDNDGIPDFIDLDTDDDSISDFIEAYDIDSSGIANLNPLYSDVDQDGLDDAFDNVDYWTNKNNPFGCISPLPDFNKNGIREWREDRTLIPQKYLYEQKRMYIYPNPTKNKFSVFVPIDLHEQKIELLIYTMSGKLIHSKIVSPTDNEVEMPIINPGYYIVKYKTEKFWQTDKLIISQ